MAHMRLSDLIESYYSNLTDEVETDSPKDSPKDIKTNPLLNRNAHGH